MPSQVEVRVGNLLESSAQTLVNTVNCAGIMGKGIALQFKDRFPEMFRDYVERCARREVKLGRPYLYTSLIRPWILNFPTKDHWRSRTRLQDIEEGLRHVLANYDEWGITSIAVPPLGCGNGQLEWRVVGPTLFRYLAQMRIPVELYAPHGTPHAELTPKFLDAPEPMPTATWIQPGWVALVDILRRLEAEPYRWPVGRTVFQKIAYVATASGVPTQLEYARGSYGPFAKGLKAIESRLLNNGLVVERQKGRMFEVAVGPTFADARSAYASDLERLSPILDRISDLFQRLNTDRAEIAATVLFAAREADTALGRRPTEREVFDRVLAWKIRRKPPLNADDVALGIRYLAGLGWLGVTESGDLPLPEESIADAY